MSPGRFLLSAAAFALTRPGFTGRLSESALAQLAALAAAARGFERAESPALREAAFAVTDLHESGGVLVCSRVIRLDQALSVACRALAEGESPAGGSGSQGEPREPARLRGART